MSYETLTMHWLDWLVVVAFFVVVLGIGILSGKKVKNSSDFFVGGGKVPWWLSGISHHVSGYSGVVFVGYAGIAYSQGISIYFWWAVVIAISVAVGAVLVAPRWPRLRRALGIQSVTEYLQMRYNKAAQLLVAIAGIGSKLLDVAAKWVSIGLLLYGFTGMPLWVGVFVSGIISLVYMAIGGIMADLWTDFVQFIVQVAAGLALFFGVLIHLGDYGYNMFTVFEALPAGNTDIFLAGRGQGSLSWTILYFFTVFFSYNGGTWNLAARYISTPDGKDAKKSAFFSAALYLFWPLILFFPMWVGPVIFPGMDQKTAESLLYASLTNKFLPTGMIGLVLASMFANTMTMCNSDANTIAAVITRDIVPVFKPELKNLSEKEELFQARLWTAIFTAATVVIALFNDYFGGVTGLILSWFAALLGPTAIPLIFGLFPCFKYSDGKAAVISTIAGLGVFVLTKCGIEMPADIAVAAPLFVSAFFYIGIGLINKYALHQTVKPEIEDLMVKLSDKNL